MKKNLKERIVKFGEHMAYDTVGKSYPYMFYEPKVPTSLKEQISKECK